MRATWHGQLANTSSAVQRAHILPLDHSFLPRTVQKSGSKRLLARSLFEHTEWVQMVASIAAVACEDSGVTHDDSGRLDPVAVNGPEEGNHRQRDLEERTVAVLAADHCIAVDRYQSAHALEMAVPFDSKPLSYCPDAL